MNVEIKIDSEYPVPKVIILTAKVTEEVEAVMRKLESPQTLTGCRNGLNREGVFEIIEQSDIIRLYAASGKVFAVTEKGEYTMRLRLYELEARLEASSFVRISNSEIINLKKARSFDLSLAGTICVSLSNGDKSYVSRRCVSKVKQTLGI